MLKIKKTPSRPPAPPQPLLPPIEDDEPLEIPDEQVMMELGYEPYDPQFDMDFNFEDVEPMFPFPQAFAAIDYPAMRIPRPDPRAAMRRR
ncbi:unnamed protein product [Caenorhabditis bovis]|uniref:Uncharacterized protein n=1 Tax=Caenorhabditis bovis TaxID=2654633 RepID=A0A8S1EMR4_9PELO|nr:unnamed protein product [Caenorhabditis bovis]